MDKREKVNRGQNAARVLDEPVIKAALADMHDIYINDWKTSKVDDVVKRERAYAQLCVLNDFIAALQSYVDTGKIVGKQLERDQRL